MAKRCRVVKGKAPPLPLAPASPSAKFPPLGPATNLILHSPTAMSDTPTPDDATLAEQAYSAARRHAREGDYAAALERHEWFHAHALTHQPSYYGVRISFALGAWKELGEKYPPALKSLKRIRDRDSDKLRAGVITDATFHDVVAINRTLKEDGETMTLFRKIEAASPQIAQRLFRFMIIEALGAAPDLFLRYTPDLMGHYTLMSQQHRDLRQRTAASLAQASHRTASTPASRREQLIKFDVSFRATAQQLAQLAQDAGQLEVAARILAATDALMQELQSATDADLVAAPAPAPAPAPATPSPTPPKSPSATTRI
jgi:hypothetical protein